MQGEAPAEHACRVLGDHPVVLTCNGNYLDRVDEREGSYLVHTRNAMHTNERTRAVRSSGLASTDGAAALQLALVNNFEVR